MFKFMKMGLVATGCALLLIGALAQAAEEENCYKIKHEIEDAILAANTCWEDGDCTTVHYGCPFHPAMCHHFLTGKENGEDRQTIRERISHYKKQCVEPDLEKKQQCKAYDTTMRQSGCEPDLGPLLCVKGKCVTQTHIFLQKGATDGVDVFGSRAVNIPEEDMDKHVGDQ